NGGHKSWILPPTNSTIATTFSEARPTMILTLRKEDWFHPDGFPLVVARRDPQEPFGLHSHEFSEIVIICGGTGLHVTSEETWPLAAGDVFVIGGSRPHDYQDMDGLKLINILFDPADLRMDP